MTRQITNNRKASQLKLYLIICRINYDAQNQLKNILVTVANSHTDKCIRSLNFLVLYKLSVLEKEPISSLFLIEIHKENWTESHVNRRQTEQIPLR